MTATTDITGIGPALGALLKEHGFDSAEAIALATPEQIMQVPRIGALRAPILIALAKSLIGSHPASAPKVGTATDAGADTPAKQPKASGKTSKKKSATPAERSDAKTFDKSGKKKKADKRKDKAAKPVKGKPKTSKAEKNKPKQTAKKTKTKKSDKKKNKLAKADKTAKSKSTKKKKK